MNSDVTMIFSTDCRECLFCNTEKGVQVDCTAGKLDVYMNLGKAKLDGNFYKIEGLCQSCRNYQWAKEKNLLDAEYLTLSKIIREENRVTHDLIITHNCDLESLNRLLKQFADKKNRFDNIIIIVENPDFKEIEAVIKNNYPETKFNIVLDILKDKKRIKDQQVAKSKSFFCTFVNSTFEPEINYTETLTKIIVDDCKQVSMVLDNGIATIQTILYNLVAKAENGVIETIVILAEQQGMQSNIINWSDVYAKS